MMQGWPRTIESYTRLWLNSVGLTDDKDPRAQAIWSIKREEAMHASRLPTVEELQRRSR